MEKKRLGTDRLSIFLINNKALLILLVMAAITEVLSKGLFLTYGNLSSLVRQTAVPLLLSTGYTAILAAGGVDLSPGQMVSLLCVVYAMSSLHVPLPVAILLSIVVGIALGAFNGFIIEGFGLPAFIVTLGTGQIFRAIAYLVSGGTSISGLGPGVAYIGQGMLFGVIPLAFVIALAVLGLMGVLIYCTRYGRHIIATGGNPEAARVSGINPRRVRISIYILMGVCSAIGAIILTGRTGTGMPSAGVGMEMDAIAAVVIGGTPMVGGKARVSGTFCGCLIMSVISNCLNLTGISSFWQWFAKGVIILLAILMDAQTQAFFDKRRKVVL